MAAETLWVRIMGQDMLSGKLKGISKDVDGLNAKGSRWGTAFAVGSTIAVAGLGAVAAGLYSCVKAAMESEVVTKETEAIMKTTGSTAWTTSDHIGKLSTSIMKYSGFSDEAVQAGANMMLTFTQVQNRGTGANAVFDRSIHLSADLARKFGTDIPTAAKQLGKALQDPISGVTALRRVGVQLDENQQNLIKNFMAQGDIMSAQKIILDEVQKQVGGVAEAYGDTLPGKLARAKENFDNLKESIGNAFIPVLSDIAEWLANIDWDSAVKKAKDFFSDLKAGFEGAQKFWEETLTGPREGGEYYQNIQKAQTALNNGLKGINEAIRTFSPEAQATWGALAASFPAAIESNNPEVINKTKTGLKGMLKAMTGATPELKGKQEELMNVMLGVIARKDFKPASKDKVRQMAEGIAALMHLPPDQVWQIMNKMHSTINANDFTPDGQAKAGQFADGLRSGAEAVAGATSELMAAAQRAVADPIKVKIYVDTTAAVAKVLEFINWAAQALANALSGDGGRPMRGTAGDSTITVPVSGGGPSYNVSVNAGYFLGTPAEARRAAKMISKYLASEGAR